MAMVQQLSGMERVHSSPTIWIWLIDFKDMSTRRGLVYT